MQNNKNICRPAQPWIAKHNKNTQTTATLSCKTHQNTIRIRRPPQPWVAKHNVTATFKASFREHWYVQYNARSNSWSLKFAVRYSFAPSTHRFLREAGSSTKTQMCVYTAPCIPKCDHVRFATAACAKMYESIDHRPTCFAQTKKWGFTTGLVARHHAFDEIEGCATAHQICVSLQLCAIDTVFSEKVAWEQTKFTFRYSFGRSTPCF